MYISHFNESFSSGSRVVTTCGLANTAEYQKPECANQYITSNIGTTLTYIIKKTSSGIDLFVNAFFIVYNLRISHYMDWCFVFWCTR